MSKYKTYKLNKSVSRYSLQIEIGDNHRFILFTTIGFGSTYASGYPEYSTKDPEVQKAIEELDKFKNGQITLEREVDAGKSEPLTAKNEQPKEPNIETSGNETNYSSESAGVDYPDVKTIQEAKEVLRGEPYNIAHQKLKTPESILAAAAEVGAIFPNLK